MVFTLKNLRITILITLFIGFSNLYSQNVSFGSRPTVYLNDVDESSVEKGILYIKVSDELKDKFELLSQEKNGLNMPSLGSQSLENLFERYRIDEVKAMFPEALFSLENKQHRSSWGFDQWFMLRIDQNTSPILAAQEFLKSPQVVLAEPVYKIIRMNGEGGWDQVEHSARNPFENQRTKQNSVSNTKDLKGKWLPNDPYFNQQAWHYNKIDMQNAWAVHNGGDNVIVSVHDGGIQFTHPDLYANIWGPVGPDGAYTIPDSHGTHVGGTVAAVSNNALGVAGVAGGDGSGNGARLMSVDIFDGTFSTYQGYVFAAQNGASISQNSWSYQSPNVYNAADLEGIDYFFANGGGDVLEGGVVIFAAGNDDSSLNWYPAFYEKTIAVAATTQTDSKASFSNYGTWVDISAPGVSIYSTDKNSSYRFMGGTSMACPHVSGVAALIVSIAPRVLNNELVKEILMESADDHYEVNPGYVGQLGTGRLNAFNALQLASAYAIDNPLQFVTEAISKTEISIGWELNDDSMPVLLAYNTTNNFGIPLYEYSVDDIIQGGGEVLYFGTETSFVHENLEPGTTYYYKLWSYNGSNYSAGLFSVTTTVCNIYGIPFEIAFDDADFPNCWGNISHTEPEMTWLVSNTFGGMYGSGVYFYFLFDSYGFGDGTQQDADLISPKFDFTNEETVYLSFNHYFRHRPGHFVSLHYSIDGGDSWQEKAQWIGTTQNPELFSQRIPEVEGQGSVYFKWNYQGSWGYFWCIDSIMVTSTPLVGINSNVFESDEIKLYPNPFTSEINIPLQNKSLFEQITVYNMYGVVQFSKPIINVSHKSEETLNLSHLPKGVYIIELKGRNATSRNRIVKQ